MDFKANYEAIAISAGSPYTYGTGTTAVHQIYCLSTGNITIKALGGGTFTWSATTNTSIDVVVGSATALTGSFIGFRSKNYPAQGVRM